MTERERKRQRERGSEREGDREREREGGERVREGKKLGEIDEANKYRLSKAVNPAWKCRQTEVNVKTKLKGKL